MTEPRQKENRQENCTGRLLPWGQFHQLSRCPGQAEETNVELATFGAVWEVTPGVFLNPWLIRSADFVEKSQATSRTRCLNTEGCGVRKNNQSKPPHSSLLTKKWDHDGQSLGQGMPQRLEGTPPTRLLGLPSGASVVTLFYDKVTPRLRVPGVAQVNSSLKKQFQPE